MDFTTDGILSRMREALKNEDTKIEGSFTMDNLQAVSEELARFNAMRIVPLMNTLSDKEDDMGTSGNPKHYVRWAKEATDADGNVIAGNAKVETPRDGSGFVSIAIITTDAKIPSAEQIRIVQEYIDGKRPVGADPVVSAAEGLEISIVCSFRKEPGYTDETVKQQIKNNVEAYFLQIAFQSGLASLNYYTISNIVDGTDGVKELENLLVNGGKESITAEYNKYFELKELIINVT